MRVRLLPLLSICLAGPLAATAEEPCAADAKALCSQLKPGSGRIAACLRERRAEVSGACRERLDADERRARNLVEEFGRSCMRDVERFCRSVEPGGGRVIACLDQHQLDVSTSCRTLLDRFSDARERVTAVRKSCVRDLERICPGVPPLAGPVLECLEANAPDLSSECKAADVAHLADAASIVDLIEQTTRRERIKEALEILQGLDSVAFTRSQVLIQLDSYKGLVGQGNAYRVLFNPQFVFGSEHQFSFQVKVPVTTLFPYTAGTATVTGVADVTAAFAWNFFAQGRVRQYLALGLQCDTGWQPVLGAPWAVQPAYAVAVGLARWVSLTTQLVWVRSLGSTSPYPDISLWILEPILVASLPGRTFLALDTRLGWNAVSDTFVPLMKGVAGLYPDRERSLLLSAWYQGALSTTAASQTFQHGFGLSLAYFFD